MKFIEYELLNFHFTLYLSVVNCSIIVLKFIKIYSYSNYDIDSLLDND